MTSEKIGEYEARLHKEREDLLVRLDKEEGPENFGSDVDDFDEKIFLTAVVVVWKRGRCLSGSVMIIRRKCRTRRVLHGVKKVEEKLERQKHCSACRVIDTSGCAALWYTGPA